jgi:hypothetical protein
MGFNSVFKGLNTDVLEALSAWHFIKMSVTWRQQWGGAVFSATAVLCGCQNKQPLFPYTALTDWFL